MSGIHWQLAGPDARLRDYEPCVLLVYDDARSRILKVAGDADGRQLRVTSPMARLPFAEKEFPENDFRLSYSAMIGELAERSLGSRARVMFLPPLQPSGSLAFVVGICLGVLLVLATIFLLGGDRPLGISGVGVLFLPLAALLEIYVVVPVVVDSLVKRYRILGQEKLGVTPGNVHEYALAVERGELWRGALPAGAAVSPGLQVERIRGEYGRLRGDLIYRVECPALFDPVVPRTAAFERALVEFDDDPSSERADRVELAFVLARQHAERVGIRHAAPEFRDGLRRAVKAARLVVGAGTEGERDAAIGQLQRILDSLALYYLPDRVSRPVLTDGTNHPE